MGDVIMSWGSGKILFVVLLYVSTLFIPGLPYRIVEWTK